MMKIKKKKQYYLQKMITIVKKKTQNYIIMKNEKNHKINRKIKIKKNILIC